MHKNTKYQINTSRERLKKLLDNWDKKPVWRKEEFQGLLRTYKLYHLITKQQQESLQSQIASSDHEAQYLGLLLLYQIKPFKELKSFNFSK